MPPSSLPSHDSSDAVRKALKLTRYETPPPGYFEHFSSRVIAKIEAQALTPTQPWWEMLLSRFLERPSLAGVLGLLAGILLVAGVASSNSVTNSTAVSNLLPIDAPIMVQAAFVDWRSSDPEGYAATLSPSEPSSTSPVVGPSPLLSAALPGRVDARPVSFWR